MAISIVDKSNADVKEQARDSIVSAKGTYAALLLVNRTDNSTVNVEDLEAAENNARKDRPENEGQFVYFWCPSVDGIYKVTGRVYNFVDVPKFAEDGTEIKYRAGDVIDISFDDGDITSPRFVRLWGLIYDSEGYGHDSMKANLKGIKSGNFPSVLEGALNLYSLQVGTPAYNLYPYLCRILTGIDNPDIEKYRALNTEKIFNERYATSDARIKTAISSRFLYSFYFTSYWSSVVDMKEEDLVSFDPWSHNDQQSTILNESSSNNRYWCNHLEPYWSITNDDVNVTLIGNLIKFLFAVSKNGVSTAAQQKAEELLLFYTKPFYSEKNIRHFTDIMHDELEDQPWKPEGYYDLPINEFSQGINVRFAGPGHGIGNILGTHYEIRTKSIVEAIRNTDRDVEGFSKQNDGLIIEAVSSYLTAILNLTIDYFGATKAHQFFDVLAFTVLYPYLRYFYSLSIDVPNVRTDQTDFEDFSSEDGRGSSTVSIEIFNIILEWAKGKVKDNKNLNSISRVEGNWTLDKSKQMAKDMANIMYAVRSYYTTLDDIDKKYAMVVEYLSLFKDCNQISGTVEHGKNALTYLEDIYNMIKSDPEFESKINNVGDLNGGSGGTVLPSGQLVWPVPDTKYGDVFSGFMNSKWPETNPRAGHKGIDISSGGINGKPVVAAKSGTLTVRNNSCTHNYEKETSCGCGGGYGNWVSINHGGGFETRYAHLSSAISSLNGQYVEAGTEIGYVGSTGESTGPHLHFETRVNGTPVDPYSYYVGAATTPGGQEFSLPDPYPSRIFNSYMSYLALDPSPIYRFINDNATVDPYGIMTIGGAYCVAMGTYYNVADSAGRRWGRIYEITMESGSVFKVITTDTKSDAHTNSTHQYHREDNSILEFVVNIKYDNKNPTKSPVYSGDPINTKAPWKGKIKKIVFLGIHPKAAEYNW